jgi:hypothetical protein
MKYLVFLLSLFSIVYAQEISSFRDKKEVFLGLNRDLKFDTIFIGFNTGYTRRIADTKRVYYRLDAQYTKRYYTTTSYTPKDEFWYKNLFVKSLVLNNMVSYRFYQKRKDLFYFELGTYLGVNLWQQKDGQTVELEGFYQYKTKDFKKNYFLLPNDFGIHLGFGIRLSKHILLKPELRFAALSFDKLFKGDSFFEEMMRNTKLLVNFNISYLF